MSAALCRCICGTGKKDQLEFQQSFGSHEFSVDIVDEADEGPIRPPLASMGRLSFSLLQQPLRGTPIREGMLWYLSSEDQVDPVFFSLYVNGFSFEHEGVEAAVSLSPFVLVRNCKFQSGYSACLSDVKIFKISLFAHNACYYFGIRGKDERLVEEERSRWVLDVSRAVRLVTQSIFPPFRISCDPLRGVASTALRLMAGYLVHHDDAAALSVLFCELHAHQEDRAKIVMYENELCQAPLAGMYLSESSMCSEKIGINCSCFSIEEHQFSTKTIAERKLWLRAISNVRVKLQNRAPDPTEEELTGFRNAIKEHLLTVRAAVEGPGLPADGARGAGQVHSATRPVSISVSRGAVQTQAMDPLLSRCHVRKPTASWSPGQLQQNQQLLLKKPVLGRGPTLGLAGPMIRPMSVAHSPSRELEDVAAPRARAREPEEVSRILNASFESDLGQIRLHLEDASKTPSVGISLDEGAEATAITFVKDYGVGTELHEQGQTACS